MNRRNWMQVALGGLVVGGVASRAAAQPKGDSAAPSIVVDCDLKVAKGREQEMLKAFHGQFKPAAMKFDGYIDIKMLRYDHKVQGADIAPGVNYRLQLTYESLALQQKWVNSDAHKTLWPLIGKTLLNPDDFQVLAFDVA